jgi:hypothetical protein
MLISLQQCCANTLILRFYSSTDSRRNATNALDSNFCPVVYIIHGGHASHPSGPQVPLDTAYGAAAEASSQLPFFGSFMILVATLVRTIHCPTHCLQDSSRQQHNQQQCQLLHHICAHGCKVQRATRIKPPPTPHCMDGRWCGCARAMVATAATNIHRRGKGVLQDTGAKGDGGGCSICSMVRRFDLSHRHSHCAICSQPQVT